MIRTGYSFKTAAGHLQDVLARIKECGWNAAPITDRCSTFGFMKWRKLCEEAEIKPVYGVELGVKPDIAEKPVYDYWKFLATGDLRPLHELIYLATSNPGKVPSLTYKQALAAQGVIKISGSATLLQHVVGAGDDFYVGLSPATPRGLYHGAKDNFRFCAVPNNFYPRKEDKEFYRVMLDQRADNQSYPQHITDDEEWNKALSFASEGDRFAAIVNRMLILNSCNTTLKKAEMLKPAKPQTLREMCFEGAALLGVDLTNQVYLDRLDRELGMINEKQFEDYFYIVAELVQWAKERMVVGPGRGSSSGSLVCYLLRITAIDPIPYGLLFERFIDVTRNDLPDIDIDFDDTKRDNVFLHAEEIYGKHKIARLGTVGMYQPRSILNAVAKSLRIGGSYISQVADSMIERSSGDSRALQQLEDTLTGTDAGQKLLKAFPEVKIAGRMEGHPDYGGQHAAGIIITEQPILDFVAVDARSGVAMCDKKDAEELGLLKIDALGLKQLSVFGRTLELTNRPNKSGILEQLPIGDEKAFDVLNNYSFSGIFQFTGKSLKTLVRDAGVKSLDDMVAITSLARPGPMGTGGTRLWVKRRTGQEPVSYQHEMIKPFLEETLGTVIFQEQVMKIGHDLGGLSWRDVAGVRKAMSKSLGTEVFDQYGDKWKARVIEDGMPEDIAVSIWKDLCRFGLYGFNKSHAVAYSIVSYWCCYLKAHFPLEFAAATLDSLVSTHQQIEYLRELKEEGIDYVPIDINHSIDKWVPSTDATGKRVLTGPLTNVKGIGPVAVTHIMRAKLEGVPIPDKYRKLLVNAVTAIDTLTPIKDHVAKNVDLKKRLIVTQPMPIKEVQCGVAGEVMIIGVVKVISPRDENEAVNVEKRKAKGWRNGGVITDGNTKSINMFFLDDTDEIFVKLDRFDYEDFGDMIIEHGKPGKAIYAVKGTVPPDFRMIKITGIRHLCDLDEKVIAEEQGAAT